jgi:hypothetical protein
LEAGFQQQQRLSAPFRRVFSSSRGSACSIRRGGSIHQHSHELLALGVASDTITLRDSHSK